MATLTNANSVITLTIPGIFNSPQTLYGFSADNMFTTSSIKSAEGVMGVDGRLSFGWVPQIKTQDFMLQADSPSMYILDQWVQTQNTAREIYACNGTIYLPGVGMAYTLTRGALESYNIMPDGQKTLAPRKFTIIWQDIIGASVNA
jgi:hypothetical protein